MNELKININEPLVPYDFICDTSKATSPIEMTTSWLAANVFEGCSCDCVYCFRHRWNNENFPRQVITVAEAYEMLTNHKQFEADYTPITANVASTDSMHPVVSGSTLSLIKLFEEHEHKNPFGIVTKLGLSNSALAFLCALSNVRPIVLVSYSAMPNKIEPVPFKCRIDTMRKAKDMGLPIILLYKPIVQGWNDSDNAMIKVFSHAGKYADAIVYGGIRLDEKIAEAIKSAGVDLPYDIPDKWGLKDLPEDIEEHLHLIHSRICSEVPLYRHTSCAVSNVLHIPNYNLLHNTSLGDCSATCPAEQRKICQVVAL